MNKRGKVADIFSGVRGHETGTEMPENKADYWNTAAFQHRITPLPKAQCENIISCFWLLLYLQRAASQLGLFHWVPSDADGVPWAKFKSLVVPMLGCSHLHEAVCVCVCVIWHLLRIEYQNFKLPESGAILLGPTNSKDCWSVTAGFKGWG